MLYLSDWSRSYLLFLLLVTRLGAFLTVAPFFGSRNIQPSLRFLLTLLLGVAFLPLFSGTDYPVPEALLPLAFALIKELVLGLALGFVASIIFSAFQVAGQIIDLQIGFGMVNVLDPQSGAQVPLLGNLLYLLALIVFLSTDGHHYLLHALWTSWRLVPPGAGWGSPEVFEHAVRAVGVMFLAGIEIAAPVLGALFLADLALGIVARTMPQLNIFVVGLPLKSILGIGMVAFCLPTYGLLLRALLTEVQVSLEAFLSLLPPG